MTNRFLFAAGSSLAIACAAVAFAPAVHAATMEGQTFDDSVRLGAEELRLNGLGIRAVFIFKGYVAGLYLKNRASSLQEVTSMTGPKRLQMRMLLSAGPDDYNRALVAGIRVNATETELLRLNDRIVQLEQTIVSFGSTVAGDVIDIDYLPGRGTHIAVNGVAKGRAIEGADFYHAVLGIFVGSNPVDGRLKKGLLGL